MPTIHECAKKFMGSMTVELTHPEVCEALRKYARDNGIPANQAAEEILHYFLGLGPTSTQPATATQTHKD